MKKPNRKKPAQKKRMAPKKQLAKKKAGPKKVELETEAGSKMTTSGERAASLKKSGRQKRRGLETAEFAPEGPSSGGRPGEMSGGFQGMSKIESTASGVVGG